MVLQLIKELEKKSDVFLPESSWQGFSTLCLYNGRCLEDGGTDGINQGKKHHSDTNR